MHNAAFPRLAFGLLKTIEEHVRQKNVKYRQKAVSKRFPKYMSAMSIQSVCEHL
jgi:hypothetical protein